MTTEFTPFPKIARYAREVVVTEKIDGTNASIFIGDDGSFLVGSRTRWITPEDDNFGFAAWCEKNRDDLMRLGPGHHFGEWWGSGIQRGYGLTNGERRFSLFNTSRWSDSGTRPACVGVVPELWRGSFEAFNPSTVLERLKTLGSEAAPGFMKPEGIVIFHTANGALFKRTLEKDEEPKSKARSFNDRTRENGGAL